jgi:multidrug efflux pump
MSVSAPFIRRPIATSLLGIATMLCGVLGYWLLPVAPLPQVDFPTIQITTRLPGANPETMASLVTASLERQFGQISALSSMTSSSSYGISQITLQFELNRDIDAAAQDVQAAINAAGSTLPKNLPYPPTYSKVNPADVPIIAVALTSPTVSLQKMSDIADTVIAQRLAQVTGVGRVSIEGGIRPATRIQADLARLTSYGLGLEDLRSAITGTSVAAPKGSFDGPYQSHTIAANDQIMTAEAYRSVVVAYRNGAPVMLTDVARVSDGLENSKVGGWYNGAPAVIIDIQRQPGANVIDTVQRIRRELPRLERAVPAGVKLSLVHDRTGTIHASIRNVEFTLILAVALVVLVVLLFLRNIRATIVAGVTLPLSLITTFGFMWLCSFSVNNLSLMALTIGTGFVVDDAIVMIENIVRHIENGEAPFDAALRGSREIGFTVISLTMSLIAVFIPLLFMTGLVGRMFSEFAWVLTIVVLVSGGVSLTLTPMMCSLLLRRTVVHDSMRMTVALDHTTNGIIVAYDRVLQWVLRHQTVTLLLTIATLGVTIWLYIVVPKGFLPQQDTGLITAMTEAGPDVSFGELQRLQVEVAARLNQDPDVTGVISAVGASPLNPTGNVGHFAITLKPRGKRRRATKAIIADLRQAVASIPGIHVYFQPVQDIQISTRATRAQYQYTLISSDSGEVVNWSTKLADGLRLAPALRDVFSEAQGVGLRTFVKIDRQMAARFGISVQAVNDTLYDAFGQRPVSTIYAQANQYRVILEALPQYQNDPAVLSMLYVPSASGTQVPLSTFSRVEQTTAPLSITHQAQFPAVTISFNLAPNSALSEAVAEIAAAERDIGLPPSVVGSFSGESAEFARSLKGEVWLIVAAIVTIYIVLGVLYESFIHPLTILSTLPSAGVGALVALVLCRQDLSLVALIGVVLLMGIVKKNAIMMIDFALHAERNEGLLPHDAIVKACLLRFRPIMMTTFAALLGASPLAIENGTGSELRFPLGITVIGGLLLSQLLTLFTTPVVYLQMARLSRGDGQGGDHPVARTRTVVSPDRKRATIAAIG